MDFTITFNTNDINMIDLVLSDNFEYLMQENKGTPQDRELLDRWLQILNKIEIPMKEKGLLYTTTEEYYKGGE